MDGRGDRETAPLDSIGPVTITTPGDSQIVVTRLFDAPRAVVFEAWTKAEHVAHWWEPKRCTACGLRNRFATERGLSLGEPCPRWW